MQRTAPRPLVIPPYSELVMTGSWKQLPGVLDGSWEFPDATETTSARSGLSNPMADDDGPSESDEAGGYDHGYERDSGMSPQSPNDGYRSDDRPQSFADPSAAHGATFSYFMLIKQQLALGSGDPAYYTLRDST